MNELKEILVGMLVVIYGLLFYFVGRTNFLEKLVEMFVNHLEEIIESKKGGDE